MAMPAKSARLSLVNGNKSRYVKAELEKRAKNEEKMKIFPLTSDSLALFAGIATVITFFHIF